MNARMDMGKRLASPRPGLIAVLAVALGLFVSVVGAGEKDDAYRELMRQYELVNDELKRAILQMDYPDPIPEYPDRLLSARKNATVVIGGELRLNYVFGRNNTVDPDQADPFLGDRRLGQSKIADLQTTTAKLTLDAQSGRWRAFIDMNLNGYSGYQPVDRLVNPNRPGDPDPTADYERRDRRRQHVAEAYIELLKDGHSGLGFKAGLVDLPFGLREKPDLIGRSFMETPNLAGSYLMRSHAQDGGNLLPHASKFLDPAVAAMLSYEMRDIIRFEAAIFQDRENRRYADIDGGSYTKTRSETTIPLSHQFGISILPLEGWELSAAYRNRHSRSRGIGYWANTPHRSDFRSNLAASGRDPAWDGALGQWVDGGDGAGFGSRRNEQAFTIGVAVEIPGTMLSVHLEYAHGWNQGFNKYINSDNVNFGLSYRLTPTLTLHGQAEWLHVKDRSWMADAGGGLWARDTRNHRLYRFLVGLEYELMRNLVLEGGWQYEYWNFSSAMGAGGAGKTDRVLTANMFYLGSRFLF